MEIVFHPRFVRQYKKLEESLREEIREKIALLKDNKNHPRLRIHKLHGPLRQQNSFSVNYRVRIVFEYLSKKRILLLDVGSHDVYHA